MTSQPTTVTTSDCVTESVYYLTDLLRLREKKEEQKRQEELKQINETLNRLVYRIKHDFSDGQDSGFLNVSPNDYPFIDKRLHEIFPDLTIKVRPNTPFVEILWQIK